MRRILAWLALAAAAIVAAPAAHATNVIQSIHHCSLTIASGAASQTSLLGGADCQNGTGNVVIGNTMIVYGGVTTTNTSTTGYQNVAATLALSGTNSIVATREGTGAFTTTVNCDVIEFSGHVNSIVAGTIAITAGNLSNTAPIAAGTANAFVLFEGTHTSNATATAGQASANVFLTNSTTVTASIGVTLTSTFTVGYMVVDLDSTIINTVEAHTFSDSSTNSSYTQALTTTVTPANTVVFYDGMTWGSTSGTVGQVEHEVFLSNGSTVTMKRVGAGNGTRIINFTVVQLQSAILTGATPATRGEIVITAATSNTASVSCASGCLMNYNGYSGANGAPSATSTNETLTNSTTVTAAVNAAGTVTAAYEVAQFSGSSATAVPKQTLLGVGMLDWVHRAPHL